MEERRCWIAGHLVGEPVEVTEGVRVGSEGGGHLGQPGLEGAAGVGPQGAAPPQELRPREPAHLLRAKLPRKNCSKRVIKHLRPKSILTKHFELVWFKLQVNAELFYSLRED